MMVAERESIGITVAKLLPEGVQLSGGSAKVLVEGITLDSRDVQVGDLFLAFPGESHDGRDFIAQALEAGAVSVLVEAKGFTAQPGNDTRIIPVLGLAYQASAIAGRFYDLPSESMVITGVTGTNAKTTCTHLLAQLFALLGEKAGVVGTLGAGMLGPESVQADLCRLTETGMTTPDAVRCQQLLAELRDEGVRYVAMEVSSHSLVQDRVAGVHFDTAVFTNLSRDHLDYHGDMTRYLDAKASLFRLPGLKRAVINVSDPVGRELLALLPSKVECYRFGITGCDRPLDAEVIADNCRFSRTGMTADILSPWGKGELISTLLGEFNLSNLLAVITSACAQGQDFQQVLSLIPQLTAVPGRMQTVGDESGPQVVVDYAHTPDALLQVLDTLRAQSAGKLWCVFGCGGDRDRGKRSQMGEVASLRADRVIVTSDNPRSESPEAIIKDILQGVSDATLVEPDRRAAIREAIIRADSSDTVLIAGKGHESNQEIAGVHWPFDDVAEATLALNKRLSPQAEGGL